MSRRGIVLAVVFSVVAVAGAHAQQAPKAGDPHHPATAPAPSTPPGGGSAGGMMGMEMCREMMGGGGMMGVPMGGGSTPMDPRMMAGMLEMRGEMMKAMGDIMIRHARKMGAMPR